MAGPSQLSPRIARRPRRKAQGPRPKRHTATTLDAQAPSSGRRSLERIIIIVVTHLPLQHHPPTSITHQPPKRSTQRAETSLLSSAPSFLPYLPQPASTPHKVRRRRRRRGSIDSGTTGSVYAVHQQQALTHTALLSFLPPPLLPRISPSSHTTVRDGSASPRSVIMSWHVQLTPPPHHPSARSNSGSLRL